MKDIGGYFGLECANFSLDWLNRNDSIGFNSGRNALRYIIRTYKINKIFVPYYTCSFVWDSIKSEKCDINFYHINKNLMPEINFNKEDFIVYNNYFGICSHQISLLKNKYENLIIDNTQAFYSKEMGRGSFNSLRKFFGVPDGGFARCDIKLDEKFEKSTSYQSCIHLLKSYDKGYDSGRINFLKNELSLDNAQIKGISNLTTMLMKNINYNKSKKIRLENFNTIHNKLSKINELKIKLTADDVPMFYPYLIKNDLLHEKLEKNGIHLISCWPDIDKYLSEDELYFKKYILPLPIDQRYNRKDMNKILDVIK